MHFPLLLLVLISVVVIGSHPESTKRECIDEISQDTSFDRAFTCPQAASLYKLFEQFEGENRIMRIKITVEKVDGQLRLQPPPNIIIISLFLQNANVTQISTKNQSSLSFLSQLDLRNNSLLELEHMQWSVLPWLTVLILRETPVTKQGLTSLLSHLPALQHLDISSSGLRSLPEKVFDKNPELQHLDLSNNEFREITLPGNLTLRLTHLNISSCQLDEVSVLTACVEGPCPTPSSQGRLRTLDVTNNSLKWLPRRLVESLKNDSFVYIKENRWDEACHRCSLYHLWQYSRRAPHVDGREELDCFSEAVLRSCGWDDCPAECDCDSGSKTVNCSGKGLVELPIVVPSETEIFLADNNVITNIDNMAFPTYCNLRRLSVERNLVTELLLSGRGKCDCYTHDYYSKDSKCFPQHLHTVSLDDNKIKKLTAADCPLLYPLGKLTMSRNKLESPGMQVCGSLEHLLSLDLSNNSIANVTSHDLATYPSLQNLNLSHNALEIFPLNIKNLLPGLKILNVSSTSIRNLTSSGTSELCIIFGDNSMVNCSRHDQSGEKEEQEPEKNCSCPVQIGRKGGQQKPELENPGAQVCSTLEHLLSLNLSNSIANVTPHDVAMQKFCSLAPTLKILNVMSNLTSGTSELCIIFGDNSMAGSCPHHEIWIVATAILIVIIFSYVCIKCVRRWYSLGRYTTKEIEGTSECKYSVFVVHSSKDRELVRENLIIPLFQRGYSVAWHENAFVPGAWILENIERAVRNSEKMVVFATDNLAASRCSLHEIRRGRCEEMDREEFKVMALVTETLPRALAKDLYEIVALRTHIQYSDRDYFEKICQFLRPPRPAPVQDAPLLSATTIRSHLDRLNERRRGHRSQSMSQVVYLHRDNEGYVIDQCTASFTKGARVSSWSQMSQEDRVQMFSKYTKSPEMPAESYAETRSLNYVLLDQENDDNEDEDSLQWVTSSRFFITRTSCRF